MNQKNVQTGGQQVRHVRGGQDTACAIQCGILLVLTGENAHQVLLVLSKILARNLAIIVVILQVKYCTRLNNILYSSRKFQFFINEYYDNF